MPQVILKFLDTLLGYLQLILFPGELLLLTLAPNIEFYERAILMKVEELIKAKPKQRLAS